MARSEKTGKKVAGNDGGLSKKGRKKEGFLREDGWIIFNFLLVIVDEGLSGKEGNIVTFSAEELDSSPKNQNQI